jgi:hypothetical protein
MEDKYMISLTWVKRVTGIGLSLMSPEAQKERMARVFKNDEINGPALAQLIDECKTSAALFLSEHKGILSAADAHTICEMLNMIDGKQIVANMAEETDAAWLLELKEHVDNATLNIEMLKTL